MSNRDLIGERISQAILLFESLQSSGVNEALLSAAEDVTATLRRGGRVLLCGNGGSQADAQHLAAELVGRFTIEREPFSAICLGANAAAGTAIANDYAFDEVFSREVQAHGRQGDVLIALSTSGSSTNVVRAIKAARKLGIVSIAFVGSAESSAGRSADHVLVAASDSTARVQEAHQLLGHVLVEVVERDLCS